MKTFIIWFLIIFSLESFSQVLTIEQLNQDKRPFGEFSEYVSVNGSVYKIGDTLRLGLPSGSNGKFLYIVRMLFSGDVVYPGPSSANTTAVIKDISVTGTKRSGFKANFKTKGVTALDNYYITIEDALQAGEIKSDVLTSEGALLLLKKAKDKLDLELITRQQYDSIKKVLSVYIK